MSRLGMPDLAVATLNDMRDNAAMIASLDPSVPLIADADTGFGGKGFHSCVISTELTMTYQALSWSAVLLLST